MPSLTIGLRLDTMWASGRWWESATYQAEDAATGETHGPAFIIDHGRNRYALYKQGAGFYPGAPLERCKFEDVIDFTRSGTATYVDKDGVVRIAEVDEPRFDYTNGIRELLLEGAATNTATGNSSAFNGSGGSSNSTVTASGDEVKLFTAGSSRGVQCAQLTGNFTADTKTPISVFVKAGTISKVQLAFSYGVNNTSHANFDLSTGVVTQTADCTARIVPIGSGWFKISMTGVPTTTSYSVFYAAAILNEYDGRLPSFEGSGETFYFSRPQIETGDFDTSYIPTNGSAVTRPADKAKLTEPVAAAIRANRASLILQGQGVSGNFGCLIGGGTGNNRLVGLNHEETALYIGHTNVAKISEDLTTPLPAFGVGVVKTADDAKGSYNNGGSVSTGTALDTNLDELYLGRSNPGLFANGWYAQLLGWVFALNSVDLAARTSPYTAEPDFVPPEGALRDSGGAYLLSSDDKLLIEGNE